MYQKITVEKTTRIYGLQSLIETKQDELKKLYNSHNYTGKQLSDLEYEIDIIKELLAYKKNIQNLKENLTTITNIDKNQYKQCIEEIIPQE